jgi:hypothetical protein
MLKWWFIFVCSLLIMVVAAFTGMLQQLWEMDHYKVCFAVILAYFVMTILVGRVTWQMRLGGGYAYNKLLKVLDDAPDMMTQLGLIGTVISFSLMMSKFKFSADLAAMLASSQLGFEAGAVALMNTAIGLIASRLLKWQTLNLDIMDFERPEHE